MRRANGTGTVCKLSGNRRRPWAVKLPDGFTEKGNVKYRYLSYHKNEKEALQALAHYIEDPYSLSKYTLKELYDEWYAYKEQSKAEGTLRNYRTAIKHMEPLWDEKVQNIDRITLQRFYSSLDVTPSIIHNIRKTMQGLISYAVKNKGMMSVSMINVHKALDLSTEKENAEIVHTVIPKEVRQMLYDNRDNDIARLILVYIFTGCRYSELRNLKPEDVHDNYIEIKQAKTAAGIRVVPLSDLVQELLPVMAVPAYSSFLGKFKEILPDYTPHDTRHTFITMMTEAKVDERIIKSIVGHSRGRNVTELYTHITLEAKLEAVNRICI